MPLDTASIVRVGVDLAKSVMHVHAVDAEGATVLSRKVVRSEFLAWCSALPPGCPIGMEASCACHYWGRELAALGLVPRLISASFVTPYRIEGRTGKNDANDAAAVCEAMSRPRMRFVPVKTLDQQAMLAVHTLRSGYVQDRTSCINRIRALLAEVGLVMPSSARTFRKGIAEVITTTKHAMSPLAYAALRRAYRHFLALEKQVAWCDTAIHKHVTADPSAKVAYGIQGIGVLGASALAATVPDMSQFKNGRQFSAWLGLVPRQRSTGGKSTLGAITRRGDGYVRKLLVLGARNAICRASKKDDALSRWIIQLRQRRGLGRAAVALANRNARTLWRALCQRSPAANDMPLRVK